VIREAAFAVTGRSDFYTYASTPPLGKSRVVMVVMVIMTVMVARCA